MPISFKYLLVFSMMVAMSQSANANQLNIEELDKTIKTLQTNIVTECSDVTKLALCNESLAKTESAMRAIRTAGANTPAAQARLAKLKVIQINATKMKERDK